MKRKRAAAEAADKARRAGKSDAEIDEVAEAAADAAEPRSKAQRSFTDPDAQMMKTNHGFAYAYNAQAVTDEFSQVILAGYVTQSPSDVNQLLVMLERINLARAAAGARTTETNVG